MFIRLFRRCVLMADRARKLATSWTVKNLSAISPHISYNITLPLSIKFDHLGPKLSFAVGGKDANHCFLAEVT